MPASMSALSGASSFSMRDPNLSCVNERRDVKKMVGTSGKGNYDCVCRCVLMYKFCVLLEALSN